MEIIVKHEITMSPELASYFQKLLVPGSELDTPLERIARINKVEDEMKSDADIPAVPEPVVKTTATDITVEQLRAAVSQKATAGKRAEIKALLTSFGAENVTSLDKDNYADFLNQVNSL